MTTKPVLGFHRLLLLLTAINFSNFFDRQLLAALAEPIRLHFGLSDTQLGGLNSAFEFTYPIASLLVTLATDRWMRKHAIAVGVTIWSVATVLTGMAGSYLMLALARAGVGLGCGGYGPAAMALLSDVYPSHQRSRTVAVHESGLMVGAALGFVLGGLLGGLFGWRVPFLVAGVPGLALGWLARRVSEPRRGASEKKALGITEQGPGFEQYLGSPIAALGQLLSLPTIRVVYLADVLISLATGGLIFWLPSFLVRIYGFSLGRAGFLAGVLQIGAGLIGILAGGWLADRWTRRHPGGRLLTLGAGFLLGTPFAIVALLSSNIVLFAAAASLAVICYSVYFPCLAPQIQDVVWPAHRAVAVALNILLGHLLGNLLSAPVIGWVSDQTGDLRYALLMVPLLALLGGLVALSGVKSAGPDRERMLLDL